MALCEHGYTLNWDCPICELGDRCPPPRTAGKKVALWDEFDPETPEPRDWVATNHEMTEDQRLDDPRHDQCRSGKFVP